MWHTFWRTITINFRSIRDFTRGDNTGIGPVRITPLKTSTAKPTTTVQDDHEDEDEYHDDGDDHDEDVDIKADDVDHDDEDHKKKDKNYEDEEDEEARRHRRKIRRQKRKKKLEKENKRKIQRDLGTIMLNKNSNFVKVTNISWSLTLLYCLRLSN